MLAEIAVDYTFQVSGRFLKIGNLDGDQFTFPYNPEELLSQAPPMDLFWFIRHPARDTNYPYPYEMDNLAVVPVTTYNDWWSRTVDAKTRNLVRKAEKKGVAVRETYLSDSLLRGLVGICNETPIRQGRRFPHYGKDIFWAEPYFGTFPERSVYIEARRENRVIGLLKMVMDEEREYACILQLLCYESERSNSPNNALISEAVAACARRGIKLLAYCNFNYGNKTDGLTLFKASCGFQRVDVRKYFICRTDKGKWAYRLGLHRKLTDRLPESVLGPLRSVRTKLLK